MHGLSEIKSMNKKATENGMHAEREYIIENRSIWARSWSEAWYKYWETQRKTHVRR